MNEYELVEKPCIRALKALGYQWLKPQNNKRARDGLIHVLLRETLISAVQRINGITQEDAVDVYNEVLIIKDNQKWIEILRGNYSRIVRGENKRKTIRLVDFQNLNKNVFTCSNQLDVQVDVQAQKILRPDLVLFVNGIPLVVIEAKTPITDKSKIKEAFDQIKQYERDIPRLFYSNLFNIITDGIEVLYGATGASYKFWSHWRDPWPKKLKDFNGDELAKSLYSLCHPERLLDLLSHFVVFETDNGAGKTLKKICRYQQFRAVNKIFNRVAEAKCKKGLIWHTQGSGKSLTMVYTTLKLRAHLTFRNSEMGNPNILVLTDRTALDDQIHATFEACKLGTPMQIDSHKQLMHELNKATNGLVLLSTIHKFAGSNKAIANSVRWIVLVDECHRTQEKNLGTYLRATLPNAKFFGFTGTPIQKDDRDTYKCFSEEGEGYLDKYSIEDAVNDGATVPIKYTARMAKYYADAQKLDMSFDQCFVNESDEVTEKLKSNYVTKDAIAKISQRITFIANDIWTHFKSFIQPKHLKAQIVAIDRESVLLYKKALDEVITEHYIKEGLSETEARELASSMSACVYSRSGEDDKPSENNYTDKLRKLLRVHQLDAQAEKETIKNFGKKEHPLSFLIVCDKLLTGFDAPIEGVMYLDKPLKEHNLLQAIARTNRIYDRNKTHGLIVDYIGITKDLTKAFSSYHSKDVRNVLTDLESEKEKLKLYHGELKIYFKAIDREKNLYNHQLVQEFNALAAFFENEEQWFTFRRKARDFIRAYESLSPDPCTLDYADDLKWVEAFIYYARQRFEHKESLEFESHSAKISEMLHEYIEVTGISTLCKVRDINDPAFWQDFQNEGQSQVEIEMAAIRKATEMNKIMAERISDNPLRYASFSMHVEEVLSQFRQGHLDAPNFLKKCASIIRALKEEEKNCEESGLDAKTYNIYKIIEAHVGQYKKKSILASDSQMLQDSAGLDELEAFAAKNSKALKQLALEINDIYTENATIGWQHKEHTRKNLRQLVRAAAHKYKFQILDLKKLSFAIEEYVVGLYAMTCQQRV